MTKLSYTSLSLYKFFEIKKVFNFKNKINHIFNNIDVKGIILVAPEGININISVIDKDYKNIEIRLKEIFDFEKIDIKNTKEERHIFRKFKIKIKK
ncbi:MAG: hypothetical protein VX089_03525, partial [Pseudomonadota bacterium]|nr:hypothetical protein [Pseudomonadota bacterium]